MRLQPTVGVGLAADMKRRLSPPRLNRGVSPILRMNEVWHKRKIVVLVLSASLLLSTASVGSRAAGPSRTATGQEDCSFRPFVGEVLEVRDANILKVALASEVIEMTHEYG